MAAAGPAVLYRRILVPVDGSGHGFHAARTAAGLARALGAKLTLLTVYEAPSSALGEPNYSRALDDVLDHARRTVEHAREAVRGAGGPEPEVEWLGGSPAETIIGVARDGNYDLIVMGSHGPAPPLTALCRSARRPPR